MRPLLALAALALASAGCATATPNQVREALDVEPSPTQPCEEDEPCWDCETMGNQVCGTTTDAAPETTEGCGSLHTRNFGEDRERCEDGVWVSDPAPTTTQAPTTTAPPTTQPPVTAAPPAPYEYCGIVSPQLTPDTDVSVYEYTSEDEYCSGFEFVFFNHQDFPGVCDEFWGSDDQDILYEFMSADDGASYDEAVGMLDALWAVC